MVAVLIARRGRGLTLTAREERIVAYSPFGSGNTMRGGGCMPVAVGPHRRQEKEDARGK